MTNPRKIYTEIDSLKGFAIFLVVLGHAIIYFPVNLHEIPWCNVLFTMLSGVHMPLFFAISGFCFSYRGNYRDFLTKKIKRLLVPYFLFNLLDLAPRALLPQLVNRPQGMLESVRDILLQGGAYWFLYTLFIIFAFYPFLYRWQAKSRSRRILVTVLCLVLSLVRIPTELFTLNLVSGYLFFFNLGVQIKLSDIPIFDFKLLKGCKLLPLAAAILWVGLLFSPWAGPLEVFVSLLSVILCCFLARWKVFQALFKEFGKFSLQIYLLNGFLLVISRSIICRFTADPVAIIGFNMLVDFILAHLAIKYICNRFKIFRFIMGIG